MRRVGYARTRISGKQNKWARAVTRAPGASAGGLTPSVGQLAGRKEREGHQA